MEMGVQNVIITLGSKGALIYCDSMVDMVPAIKWKPLILLRPGIFSTVL